MKFSWKRYRFNYRHPATDIICLHVLAYEAGVAAIRRDNKYRMFALAVAKERREFILDLAFSFDLIVARIDEIAKRVFLIESDYKFAPCF